MTRLLALWQIILATTLLTAVVSSQANAQPPAQVTKCLAQAKEIRALCAQGRYADARKMAREYITQWEQQRVGSLAAYLRTVVSESYVDEFLYDEAEHEVLRAIRQLGQPPANELILADALGQLGNTHFRQHRFAEAEREFRRALAILERHLGADSTAAAMQLGNLANVLVSSGRFLDGVPLYKRAIAIKRKQAGPDALELANEYGNLGITLQTELGRRAEAQPYLEEALRIYTKHGQRLAMAEVLLALAKGSAQASDWEQAKELLGRRTRLLAEHYGPEHPLATDQTALADLYMMQGELPEAEELYRHSLEACARAHGEASEQFCQRLCALAEVLDPQGKEVEAEEVATRAIALAETLEGNATLLARAYEIRASARSDQQRLQDAIADFRKAGEQVAIARSEISGSEIERAQLFANRYRGVFVSLAWHLLQVGESADAFRVAEQGRGRELADAMQLARVDLLAGLPTSEAASLRSAYESAAASVARLEVRWQARENSDRRQVDAQERQSLAQQLREARQQLVDAHTAIQNASPSYRRVLARNAEPVNLSKLEELLVSEHAVLLYYTLSDSAAYLVVYGAGKRDQPSHFLELTPDQAKSLGLEPGRQTNRAFSQLLLGSTGLMASLTSPDASESALKKLAILWEVLVPADLREALTRGAYAKVIVVPDGALTLLPFETLVVSLGEDPQYLLDLAPPISYVPSGTLLVDLANRSHERALDSPPRVLTLGDADYDAASTGPIAASARSRFATMRGQLSRLPNTGSESNWIKQTLGEAGLPTTQLLREAATEGNLRRLLGGQQILHLACHGLADESYGNFFGALAMTPGKAKPGDSADDGFLTLAEISQLDLRDIELALLSACQTNLGPNQDGEGVWALTRGFLIAGCRNMVGSNWVVDDEATSHLIGHFGGEIAESYKDGRAPDFASALREAKLRVRREAQWRSPYYWGPFVLVGGSG